MNTDEEPGDAMHAAGCELGRAGSALTAKYAKEYEEEKAEGTEG